VIFIRNTHTNTHTDRSDQTVACRSQNRAGNSNGHIHGDKHRLHAHIHTPNIVWFGDLIADLVWEGPVTTHSHQIASSLVQNGRHTKHAHASTNSELWNREQCVICVKLNSTVLILTWL